MQVAIECLLSRAQAFYRQRHLAEQRNFIPLKCKRKENAFYLVNCLRTSHAVRKGYRRQHFEMGFC